MNKNSNSGETKKLKTKKYEKELRKLQGELCALQDWVKHKGLRVIIIFRDPVDRYFSAYHYYRW